MAPGQTNGGSEQASATRQAKPERSSSRISLRDEALLGWFFCEGQSAFERSTFGDLLERQRHVAFQTKPCPRCNGATFTDEDLALSKRRLELGWKPEDAEPKCMRCCSEQRGIRPIPGRVLDGRVPAPRHMRRHCRPCGGSGESLLGIDCRICGGTGMRDGYDANLDGDEDSEPSYTPDDWALQRYAVASRQLALMRPALVDVLRAFYGLEGLRCGAGHPERPDDPAPGRLFAVYQLTRAGKKWLAKLEVGNNQGLSRCGLLVSQWALQSTQPDKHRRELLDACRDQAQALYEDACRGWLMADMGEGWRGDAEQIARRLNKRRRRARRAA